MGRKQIHNFIWGATLQGNSKNYEGATLSYDEAQKDSFNIMKKKKTAVQWLAEQLIPNAMRMFDAKTCNDIEEALQMEREQIEDAYIAGDQGYYRLEEIKQFAKDYCIETYGGNNE